MSREKEINEQTTNSARQKLKRRPPVRRKELTIHRRSKLLLFSSSPSFVQDARTCVRARVREREREERNMCAYRELTHRHSPTPRKRGVSASGLRRHCLPSPCPSFPSPAAHFPASIRTTQPFTNTQLYRPGRILRSGTVAAINVSGRGHVRALDPMAQLHRIASIRMICDESRCEYRNDIRKRG